MPVAVAPASVPAVPEMGIVEYADAVPLEGLIMLKVGAEGTVVSRVTLIVLFSVEIFPAESFDHAYSVLVASPLESVRVIELAVVEQVCHPAELPVGAVESSLT